MSCNTLISHEDESAIINFYKNRNVFITGGSGFMGKVLVEKLLRSCPEIGRVYLHLRSKHGSNPQSRLDELTNAEIFSRLRSGNAEALGKLTVIPGDITEEALGICPADRRTLVEEVSVVFHCAATVKFDEDLTKSVKLNVVGSRYVVELCKEMKRLESLVHVSTAYCNCNRTDTIEERIYETRTTPQAMIDLCSTLDEKIVDDQLVTARLIGDMPNTYCYTKALAERLLSEEAADLPVAVVRPSIVTASHREPIAGWIDNLNGPTGLIAGAGKGILRSVVCQPDMVADIIPVDVPINLMLAVGWFTAGADRSAPALIYNCTSGTDNPITWRQIEEYGFYSLTAKPLDNVFWFPSGCYSANVVSDALKHSLYHMLPAYLIDLVLRATGRKPIMAKIHRKFRKAVKFLTYFTTHEWRWSNNNVHALLGKMSGVDRRLFDFDVSAVDWRKYIDDYALGTRRYVLKEKDENLPRARAHLNRMWYIKQLVQILFFLMFWRVIMLKSDSAQALWNYLFGFINRILRLLPYSDSIY